MRTNAIILKIHAFEVNISNLAALLWTEAGHKFAPASSEQAPRSDHQISQEQCLCLFVYQMFTAVVVIPQGLISVSQTHAG